MLNLRVRGKTEPIHLREAYQTVATSRPVPIKKKK